MINIIPELNYTPVRCEELTENNRTFVRWIIQLWGKEFTLEAEPTWTDFLAATNTKDSDWEDEFSINDIPEKLQWWLFEFMADKEGYLICTEIIDVGADERLRQQQNKTIDMVNRLVDVFFLN